MNCHHCGATIADGAQFCPLCGAVQTAGAGTPPPVQPVQAPVQEVPPIAMPQAPLSPFVDYEKIKMFSVLSMILCAFSSIAGIICGAIEMSKIKKVLPFLDPERAAVLESAKKLNLAAIIIGSVRIALVVLYFISMFSFMVPLITELVEEIT